MRLKLKYKCNNTINKAINENTNIIILNVIGYVNKLFGVAEVPRNILVALLLQNESSKIDAKDLILPHVIPITMPQIKNLADIELKCLAPIMRCNSKVDHSFFKNVYTKNHLMNKNMFFICAEQMSRTYARNKNLFKNQYNIAVYWWELEGGFDFANAFTYIQEVIVFSTFIQKAISKNAPKNMLVSKVTYPLMMDYDKLWTNEVARSYFKISNNKFVVMFSFDLHSTIARKNPYAVIDAFYGAFSNVKDTILVLKVSGSRKSPDSVQELKSYIQVCDRKCNYNIRNTVITSKTLIIEDSLSSEAMLNLFNVCDVYLSLHRSEGLGLGMMQAMALGKVVIATNYGGNTDFMNKDNSILIDYKMEKVGLGAKPYKCGEYWASADVTHASAALTRVYHDQGFREQIGENAKKNISYQYTKENFYSELTQVLTNIRSV